LSHIAVWHNLHQDHATPEGKAHIPFFSPACEWCRVTLAYEYQGSGDLEGVWVRNQRINGTDDELPVVHATRSLSVGDVVIVDLTNIYAVMPLGWQRMAKAPWFTTED
jgi:hypothetical protein